jgi:hypothetical protein
MPTRDRTRTPFPDPDPPPIPTANPILTNFAHKWVAKKAPKTPLLFSVSKKCPRSLRRPTKRWAVRHLLDASPAYISSSLARQKTRFSLRDVGGSTSSPTSGCVSVLQLLRPRSESRCSRLPRLPRLPRKSCGRDSLAGGIWWVKESLGGGMTDARPGGIPLRRLKQSKITLRVR